MFSKVTLAQNSFCQLPVRTPLNGKHIVLKLILEKPLITCLLFLFSLPLVPSLPFLPLIPYNFDYSSPSLFCFFSLDPAKQNADKLPSLALLKNCHKIYSWLRLAITDLCELVTA